MPVITDELEDLVARAVAGDEVAFTGFVEQTLDEIRCFVALRASDADMADEAVQATYIDAFRQMARYRPGNHPVAWLKGIARHRVQRAQRERARGGHVGEDAWLRLVAAPAVAAEADAEFDDDGSGREVLAKLRACLGQLTPNTASLIDRYYREGLPLATLAQVLGRSPAGIAVTLCRARNALRTCLERQGVSL